MQGSGWDETCIATYPMLVLSVRCSIYKRNTGRVRVEIGARIW